MATGDITPLLLSASTDGQQVLAVATATPGTLIHTVVAGTSSLDQIWIYAMNNHTVAVTLTIEWGNATAPQNNIAVSVPSLQGLLLVVPGLLLRNSLTVKAFASVASKISLSGFVNRIAT